MTARATFDATGAYRYSLWRDIGEGPAGAFVMLNPSTADAEKDDPTIRRCIGFARRWGWGGLHVLNAFAFRSTDPRALHAQVDPVGPENDATIVRIASEVAASGGRIIAAWGEHGFFLYRDNAMRRLLRPIADVWALRISKTGQPCHPLYLPADSEPVLYLASEARGR